MVKDYFLDHPSLDKVMRVVIALTRETYVLKDRMALFETLLDEKGHVTRADVESYQPSEEERAATKAEADRFINKVLGPIVQDKLELNTEDKSRADTGK